VKGARLESSDRTKRRVIIQGDSLWLISSQEYGDPAQWRSIAQANGIENPRNLEAGKEIIIPPLR
jgi:nucleoid-associated protein YgaU